jgi:hypothetical protein
MIIVTGMHRSGTSFVAQLLHELGLDLGDHAQMYATDEWNAAGYFENLAVMILNDRIVLGDRFYAEAFRTNAPQDRPLLSRLLMSLARTRYLVLRSTAGVVQRAEHRRGEISRLGRRFRGMVVKDPRFSLTMSAWRKYAGVQRVLYCYRHPREVAMSIRRRDRLPQWLGLRLWAVHVEAFLANAEGLPVTLVNFNRFFDGASAPVDELARCFAFAERPYDEVSSPAASRSPSGRTMKPRPPTCWPACGAMTSSTRRRRRRPCRRRAGTSMSSSTRSMPATIARGRLPAPPSGPSGQHGRPRRWAGAGEDE